MSRSVRRAPGRVNLIGDHTDYNDGLVLPFAIAQTTMVSAVCADDGRLGITSEQFSGEVARRPIEALAPNSDSWRSYVEGAIWLLRAEGLHVPGVDFVIEGDLPVGVGLSSSAALVCATLCTILELNDQSWTTDRVASAAQRVENEYVGSPVGIMDPTVVMVAQPLHAVFLDCQSRAYEHIPLDVGAQGLSLLVFNTGAPHQTAGSVYAQRVTECRNVERLLNVSSLREIKSMNALDLVQDLTLRARARHVITENERVLETVRQLRSGDIPAIGPLMTESHVSLRDDYEVSTPELDLVVSSALGAGALGARLTGAGLGGSAIVLTNQADANAIATTVRSAFQRIGLTPPILLDVEPAAGAGRIAAG